MPKKVRYYWWNDQEMLTDFLTRGYEMVTAGQLERMEFHPDEEKGLKLIPTVMTEDEGEHEHEFNVVHKCPPDC